MTDPQIAILMMVLFIFIIMLGFPIAFTLVAMGVFFGLYAMQGRVFDLLVQNIFDIMSNDVLTAVPLFCSWGT
jgi:TRAP-type mannitol/chloroaromatic compound transport system permease large subunit